MGSIMRLPESIRSSVRSGVILYDFSRVVEELVFNSLDAGATKVSVALGVGTCYIKVDDNGSGVARDGLVLIGERYVTSKYSHLDDTQAFPARFGFKGEALSSISDVSLLEIVSKTQGRPNGYRKVLKDGKCLYLGIDDDRQDVGTTVIVRDLFYNQPVRRKQMHSNPKRVLHSVRECLLRIALLHPSISFKVVDIESEDDLLSTTASPSPLPLLSSGFGVNSPSSLNKLNANDGSLKLSGYISGPQDVYTVKVLQYFYINSRFVSKGPIHKLLNSLAMSFHSASDVENRSRSQIKPLFLLDLKCPRSFYDLTLEPSKTSVEFKDWRPILFFIEGAVKNLWTESKSADTPVNVAGKKRCRAKSCRVSFDLPSPQPKKPTEECPTRREAQPPQEILLENASEKGDPESRLLRQTEMSNRCQYTVAVNWKSGRSLQPSSSNVFSRGDDFMDNKFDASPRSIYKLNSVLSSGWEDESPTIIAGGSTDNASSRESLELDDSSNVMHDRRKPFLQSCSSRRSLLHGGASFTSNEDIEFKSGDHRTKWNLFEDDDSIEFEAVADVNQVLNQRSPRGSKTYFGPFSECKSVVLHNREKPFLQSCSLRRSALQDGASFACDEDVEFKYSDYRNKWNLFEDDDNNEFDVVDDVNQVLNQRSPRGNEIYFGPFSECKSQGKVLRRSNLFSRDSEKSSLTKDIIDEDNHLVDFVKQAEEYGSSLLSFSSDLCPLSPDPLLGSRFQDVDPYLAEDGIETSVKHEVDATCNFGNMELNRRVPAIHNLGKEASLFRKYSKFSSDVNFYAPGEDMSGIVGHAPQDMYGSGPSEFYFDGDDLSHLPSHGEEHLKNYLISWAMLSSSVDEDSYERIDAGNQGKMNELIRKSRRSHSAPPFYRGKKKFFGMSDFSGKTVGNTNVKAIHDVPILRETRTIRELQHSAESICWELPQQSSDDQSSDTGSGDCVSPGDRLNVKKKLVNIWNSKLQSQGECTNTRDKESKEEFASRETQTFLDSGSKWRDHWPETTRGNRTEELKNQDTILSITSGILHFVGDSLVPDTIDKSCLDGAKVLQQVDKKFIPIVAGATLAIIDQHAADERIRLEELREKVLSGQMRTTTYLDSEQELVMPEFGYQLIHNYAEQIQNWGWICNINSQASKSFTRNLNLIHKQPEAVALVAVPCILGVNLTDVDLLEYLQQLADTDGSSIVPPSVNRILNSKACRSAIMFGDALLHSECSLIVQELKQTSLCFQCAHGRPTTVPLVNLDALHEQISKLGSLSKSSSEAWRGLHRHEISLERAEKRFRSAIS